MMASTAVLSNSTADMALGRWADVDIYGVDVRINAETKAYKEVNFSRKPEEHVYVEREGVP